MVKLFRHVLIKHVVIFVILALYTIMLGWRLVALPTPFYDWDEAIYVQVGQEMVYQQSWFGLWQGQPWLEKPPLAPYLYGIVIYFAPALAEVTTRLLSLGVSVVVLVMVYIWVYRMVSNRFVASLTVLFTMFNPIFLQRAQVVNTDIFLLLGWLGWWLTFPSFWLSLVFLIFATMSKSVLGFYVALIMLVLCLLRRRYDHVKIILIQFIIVSLWYLAMWVKFGQEFLQVQFDDHLLSRLTRSLESHFGPRTFYLDLLWRDYGLLVVGMLVTLVYFGYKLINRKVRVDHLAPFLLFLPWFAFLNLTKTKIEWYLYPIIPQVSFLAVFLLTKLKSKKFLLLATICLTGGVFYNAVTVQQVLSRGYHSPTPLYNLALQARRQCARIAYLVPEGERERMQALERLGLTIGSSRVYGDAPSLVYYAQARVRFYYSQAEFDEDDLADCRIRQIDGKWRLQVGVNSRVCQN